MQYGILLTLLTLTQGKVTSPDSLPSLIVFGHRQKETGSGRIYDRVELIKPRTDKHIQGRPARPYQGVAVSTMAQTKSNHILYYNGPSQSQKGQIRTGSFPHPYVVHNNKLALYPVQGYQGMPADSVSGRATVLPNKEALTAEILAREETIKLQLVLATLLVTLLAIFYVKYRKMQRKLNMILQEGVEPTNRSENHKNTVPLNIEPEVVQRILLALDQWEREQCYLDTDTGLQRLAAYLDTNTSYLSKIINAHKGQTFPEYLKDLRVTHAVNHIKEHPELLNTHSTIQLAERFGFNSVDVFTRAMKSKIGLTPGMFFRKVRQQHRQQP